VLVGEDLVDEIEDLTMDGWFYKQHELLIALQSTE
jgi:hypothetical protein